MSFIRSTIWKNPSSSMIAMSPVCSQSPRIISAVASGLFQ